MISIHSAAKRLKAVMLSRNRMSVLTSFMQCIIHKEKERRIFT